MAEFSLVTELYKTLKGVQGGALPMDALRAFVERAPRRISNTNPERIFAHLEIIELWVGGTPIQKIVEKTKKSRSMVYKTISEIRKYSSFSCTLVSQETRGVG